MLSQTSQLLQVIDFSHGLLFLLVTHLQYVDLLDDKKFLILLVTNKASLKKALKISLQGLVLDKKNSKYCVHES